MGIIFHKHQTLNYHTFTAEKRRLQHLDLFKSGWNGNGGLLGMFEQKDVK